MQTWLLTSAALVNEPVHERLRHHIREPSDPRHCRAPRAVINNASLTPYALPSPCASAMRPGKKSTPVLIDLDLPRYLGTSKKKLVDIDLGVFKW